MKSQRSRFLVSSVLAIMATSVAADTSTAQRTLEGQGSRRTQGGARVSFTSLKDWKLKGENLSPRGSNPLYFPLKAGFRYVLEKPDHSWGHFRTEIIVLDKTEPFDVPGIGKFECAVVKEEEFVDNEYHERSDNWFCIDKTTNAMYTMGEVSWEIDQIGRKVFSGSWRVGEPDGNGMAEPGMLMPATFKLGDKYIYDGHEAEAYGYTENMATGLTVTTPAGTFKNCVKTREYSLISPSDVSDKIWCEGVGLISDSADGDLVASDALPGSDMSSFGKIHQQNTVKQIKPPVAQINGLQATEIALKQVPGKANSIKIERMGRHNVYDVEIIAAKDGAEHDVFVDIETGKVTGTNN